MTQLPPTRAQRLADALGRAYKQAHPDEPDPQAAPTTEELEAAGVALLRRALYGNPPPTNEE